MQVLTTDSSVGRAGDCRLDAKSDISRSLVQIRLGGLVLVKSYYNFLKFYHVVADITLGLHDKIVRSEIVKNLCIQVRY